MSVNENVLIRGLEGVVAATTRLCDLDGANGRLAYRGYEIEDLARHASFEEVTWLLWTGELPTPDEAAGFRKELVEAARAKPESIRISDSGLMAVPHTQVVMLELAAGVRFASVHFTGGAPSVTALLGGHVEALAGSTADSLAHRKSGQFRVLAVAAEEPDPTMPDVPTMKSQGFDVVAASAAGIVAPAGTPKPVVDRLTRAMKAVIDSAEHQAKMKDLGIPTYYRDPEGYAKYWIDTESRIRPLLQKIGQQR